MITQETIQKLARQYQTVEFPNIVREYFQHLFLSYLYKMEGSEKILFKGGTALRIIYGSPRFSEDLDFSLFAVEPRMRQKFIEDVFSQVLVEIERVGVKVELGPKPGPTAEGYYGDATFTIHEYPPVSVAINLSSRNGRAVEGEVKSIANEFIATYTVLQLPQPELVEEKVFRALLERKKARDFYDLYFIMRKGLLTQDQKKRLAKVKDAIIADAGKVDFKDRLSKFLPSDRHAIVNDFKNNLLNELNIQLSGI